MEGVLWKAGAPGRFGSGFRERYFVLTGSYLSWLDRKGGIPKGSVDVNGALVAHNAGTRNPETGRYRFTLSGPMLVSPERPRGEYVLETNDSQKALAWVNALTQSGCRRGGSYYLLAANETLEIRVSELESMVDTLQSQLTAAVARQSAAEEDASRYRSALGNAGVGIPARPDGSVPDAAGATAQQALEVAEAAREALRTALQREHAADSAWRARDKEWRTMVEALTAKVAVYESGYAEVARAAASCSCDGKHQIESSLHALTASAGGCDAQGEGGVGGSEAAPADSPMQGDRDVAAAGADVGVAEVGGSGGGGGVGVDVADASNSAEVGGVSVGDAAAAAAEDHSVAPSAPVEADRGVVGGDVADCGGVDASGESMPREGPGDVGPGVVSDLLSADTGTGVHTAPSSGEGGVAPPTMAGGAVREAAGPCAVPSSEPMGGGLAGGEGGDSSAAPPASRLVPAPPPADGGIPAAPHPDEQAALDGSLL